MNLFTILQEPRNHVRLAAARAVRSIVVVQGARNAVSWHDRTAKAIVSFAPRIVPARIVTRESNIGKTTGKGLIESAL